MRDEKSIAELDKLLAIVDDFSYKMKERIIKKHSIGKKGWDKLGYSDLLDKIEENLDIAENEEAYNEESLIDVANYAMFSYFKQYKSK